MNVNVVVVVVVVVVFVCLTAVITQNTATRMHVKLSKARKVSKQKVSFLHRNKRHRCYGKLLSCAVFRVFSVARIVDIKVELSGVVTEKYSKTYFDQT